MSGIEEVWLRVPDEVYEVSDLGRVRGPSGRLLSPRKNSSGYLRVCLGAGRDRYVHRLVCLAFFGPPPSGNHADHINHDRADNRAANLRWVTPEENRLRRRVRQGEAHTNAKLNAERVRAIRSANNPAQDRAFAAAFAVSRETVRDARLGKVWGHIQ